MFSTASPLRSTTLGSLPHSSPAEGLGFLHRFPTTLPTWPQLPNRHALEMLGRGLLSIIPGVLSTEAGERLLETNPALLLTDWDADAYRAREAEEAYSRIAQGYRAFREHLRTLPPQQLPPAVKCPLPGPVTLAALLELPEGVPASGDPVTCHRLGRLTAALGAAMVRELQSLGVGTVHVWLDEPAWPLALEDSGALAPLWRGILFDTLETVREAGAITGIHCCADTDFGTFAGLGLQVLSFDAAQYLPRFLSALPALQADLDKGMEIAWGIIHTLEPPASDELPDLISQWRDALALTWPDLTEAERYARSYVTPSCGLGALTVGQATAVMQRLGEFVGVAGAC